MNNNKQEKFNGEFRDREKVMVDKKENEQDHTGFKIRMLLYLTPVAILISLVLLSHLWSIEVIVASDLANWATLVVEIGIGVAISLAILIHSNSQQKKFHNQQMQMSELLSEIKKIGEKQKDMAIKSRNYSIRLMKQISQNILDDIIVLLEKQEKEYEDHPSSELKEQLDGNKSRLKDQLEMLDSPIKNSDSSLEPYYITFVDSIRMIGRNYLESDHAEQFHMIHLKNLKTKLVQLIETFPVVDGE